MKKTTRIFAVISIAYLIVMMVGLCAWGVIFRPEPKAPIPYVFSYALVLIVFAWCLLGIWALIKHFSIVKKFIIEFINE